MISRALSERLRATLIEPLLILSILCQGSESAWGYDFDRDGNPDVLWRGRETGENRISLMNGLALGEEVEVPSLTADGWRMVTGADFNADGKDDILWHHWTLGNNGVWFFDGTTFVSSSSLPFAGDLNWHMIGAGDFTGDGKPDILWQHATLGDLSVWEMDGVNVVSSLPLQHAGDIEWKAVAVADSNNDGKADILWRHASAGFQSIWLMDGTIVGQSVWITDPGGAILYEADVDWLIVGAANYDSSVGPAPDVLWRHTSIGLNKVWSLGGPVGAEFAGSIFIDPRSDTDWRIASQDHTESTWRLTRPDWSYSAYSYGEFAATVAESPPSITLHYNVAPDLANGVSISRRVHGTTDWGQPLASAWPQSTFTDANVAVGVRYDYRVLRDHFPIAENINRRYELTTAIKAPPIEWRGRLILLVDSTLAAALDSSLTLLQQDLIGDGWTVIRHDVPRHDDLVWAANPPVIANIKALIESDYTASPGDTRGIYIIGHVAVPYSGTEASDGHSAEIPDSGEDHGGAWPSDMYYGSLDGTWDGDVISRENLDLPDNSNLPGDSKWDENAPDAPLALFVGRIDFARMSELGVAPPSPEPDAREVQLLQDYLAKSHRFRHKLTPFPLNPRGIAYGGWDLTNQRDHTVNTLMYSNAKEIASGLLGPDVVANGALVVGDALAGRSRSALWGFLCGSGGPASVSGVGGVPFTHRTSDFNDSASSLAPVAFLLLNGSYFIDWNITNSLLRAPLARRDSAVATLWVSAMGGDHARLRMGLLGSGETLGAAMLRTINHEYSPPTKTADRNRSYTILGDPTLTAIQVAPPPVANAERTGTSVQISWDPSPDAVLGYFVYAAEDAAGPFARISGDLPVSSPFHYESSSAQVFLVRAVTSVTTGSGSFHILSQGIQTGVVRQRRSP